jgi:hypothetical protein
LALDRSVSDATLLKLSFGKSELTKTINVTLLDSGDWNPIIVELKEIFRFKIEGQKWKIPFVENELVSTVIAEIEERRNCHVKELRCDSFGSIPSYLSIGMCTDRSIEVILKGSLEHSREVVREIQVTIESGETLRVPLRAASMSEFREAIILTFESKMNSVRQSAITLATETRRIAYDALVADLPDHIFCVVNSKPIQLRIQFSHRPGETVVAISPLDKVVSLLSKCDIIEETRGIETLLWIDGHEYSGDELICVYGFRPKPPVIVIARRWNVHAVKVSSYEFRFEFRVGMTFEDIRSALCDRLVTPTPITSISQRSGPVRSDYILPPPVSGISPNFKVSCRDLYCQRLTFNVVGSLPETFSLFCAPDATVADLRHEIGMTKSGHSRFAQGALALFERDAMLLRDLPVLLRGHSGSHPCSIHRLFPYRTHHCLYLDRNHHRV